MAEEESEKDTEKKKGLRLGAFIQSPAFMLVLLVVPVIFFLLNAVLSGPEPENRDIVQAQTIGQQVQSPRQLSRGGQSAPYPVITPQELARCDFRKWIGRRYNVRAIQSLGRSYRFFSPNAGRIAIERPERLNFVTGQDGVIRKAWCG